jgi:hypothetical protein
MNDEFDLLDIEEYWVKVSHEFEMPIIATSQERGVSA